MADLRGEIYLAVANPKQFLWAPFELAIVNIVVAAVIMIVCVTVLDVMPFFSMIPLVLGHIGLVIAGAHNPHLTFTLRATGTYPPMRKNLSPVSKGVKYTP
jgi:hypothetical protein